MLVRAKVASPPPVEKKKGCCRLCRGTKCEICKRVVTTETFRSFSTQRKYCIKPNNLNCCSSNVVYLFPCKHARNNTQLVLKVFALDLTITSQLIGVLWKGTLSKKASFRTHFEDDKHHGISNWEITLIDQTESVDDLRGRESFWQYEINIFQPNGLNECDVALFWCVFLLYLFR